MKLQNSKFWISSMQVPGKKRCTPARPFQVYQKRHKKACFRLKKPVFSDNKNSYFWENGPVFLTIPNFGKAKALFIIYLLITMIHWNVGKMLSSPFMPCSSCRKTGGGGVSKLVRKLALCLLEAA